METYYSDEFDMNLNKEAWYTESWFDEDLLRAMKDENVKITKENLDKFRNYCAELFSDKTERNELLRDAAAYCFG